MVAYFRAQMEEREAFFDPGWRHRLISWVRDIDVVGVRFLSGLLPHLLLPAPKRPMRIRTLHGFDLWIDPVADRGVERSIYGTGTYEKGTLHFMQHMLLGGGTFVDIGANIGLMTVLAAHVVGPEGRVVAFEPNPSARAILSRNVELNGLGNVEVSAHAIGAEATRARIYEGVGSNRGRATLMGAGADTTVAEVEVIRLSDYFNATERVDMVKIDIEGFELDALKGMDALWKRVSPPMLIVEFSGMRRNSHGEGVDPIHRYLSGLGVYRFFKGRAGKERVSRLVAIESPVDLPAHDNVYCLTAEHVAQARKAGLL